jgi:O-antigen/teichoic acid export membrane protein
MKIDQIMIMDLLNSRAVGEYAAAVKISEAWYFIPTIIMTSLFPAILSAKNDHEKFTNRLKLIFKLMIIISLAISIPMTFLSKYLIILLYGNSYEPSGDVLMIHIWSSIFVFIGVANSKWFIAENLQKYYILNTTIGAILNIVLNYLFIPKYGIIAAAWATLISQFFAAYFCLFLFKITRNQLFFITKSLIN